MNKVILIGRLTRDPEISQGSVTVGKYTLAVDRRYKKDGEQTANFINCTVFGKSAEFAQKYFHKGTKLAVCGRLQTGSYTNKEGKNVYTWTVVVEEQEFAESKAAAGGTVPTAQPRKSKDDFIKVPDNVDEEELPFV